MNHSENGDGKGRAPINRVKPASVKSSHLDHPDNPDNLVNPDQERESQIIAALGGRYDQLDALWQHAEEDLKRFRLHSVVMTKPFKHIALFEDHSCGDPQERHVLGFLRCGKSWRICYGVSQDTPDGGEDGPNWTPISDCSVDLRIEVIPVFEELRKKVIETAEQSVPKLDAALANFRRILDR